MNLPSGNPYLLGDANLDGTVDGQDFLIWNSNKFQNADALRSLHGGEEDESTALIDLVFARKHGLVISRSRNALVIPTLRTVWWWGACIHPLCPGRIVFMPLVGSESSN